MGALPVSFEDYESIEQFLNNHEFKSETVGDNQVVSHEESPYTLSLQIKEFETDKDRFKFIRSCESLIRKSPEYSIWTDYLRDVLDGGLCEMTGEEHAYTKVDIHHHPFTLFDITKAVINKHCSDGEAFCSYDISKDVISLHYQLKVPFCALVRSLHEKYHNGFLRIPMELVKGDCNYFITNYLNYLDEDDIENINEKLSVNKNNCGWGNSYRWVNNTNGNDSTGSSN